MLCRLKKRSPIFDHANELTLRIEDATISLKHQRMIVRQQEAWLSHLALSAKELGLAHASPVRVP